MVPDSGQGCCGACFLAISAGGAADMGVADSVVSAVAVEDLEAVDLADLAEGVQVVAERAAVGNLHISVCRVFERSECCLAAVQCIGPSLRSG